FICYKETDENGRRTLDSVLAADLYEILQKEGYKVFYARVTLEDKFGTAYEPYIFAALQSAKVMIAVGTKPEHFEAVWVKNEWSRYLALIKNGAKKTLIPAYKDMDPYTMPMEFAHLQAINLGELGFQQDMISGIRKLLASQDDKSDVVAAAVSINTAAVLERGFLYAEDQDWEGANECFEKVLNVAPQNAQAYLGKLLVDLKVSTKEGLLTCGQLFDQNNNYKKILRFGDSELKFEDFVHIIRSSAHVHPNPCRTQSFYHCHSVVRNNDKVRLQGNNPFYIRALHPLLNKLHLLPCTANAGVISKISKSGNALAIY
ncbi:MAG: toll/interleukin-1 receptor domain-containing protein, partial [Phascolarctobacterium sp.]|nr:toll/interleukin-1 receptor domain-containing protein [Phascolarctobacterium sp.]